MSKQRQALGRGFSALLQPAQDIAPQEVLSIKQVEIKNIELNPWQPRNHFDQDQLDELAQSVRIKGVIQPILIRVHPKKPSTYELIAGERRLRASKIAGFLKIPALIKEYTDQDILEIALIENIQRSDLNALEESLAYRNLLEQHGYTQDELAKRVGKSRSTITNMIRLLNLPDLLQKDLSMGRLSQGHARCLLGIEDEAEQLKLAAQTVEEQLSVRALEQRVQSKKAEQAPQKKKPVHLLSKDFETSRRQLESSLQTGVQIKTSVSGKGKIEVSFADVNEFNRILGLLAHE